MVFKGKSSVYNIAIKRMFDIVLAAILLIILSPLYLVVSILVLIFHGSPILFTQKRPGFKGEIFEMKKFRSMSNETDENGKLLSNDKRITKFGKFIRKTSIDELPELINILKGDMSFIGPRPLLVEYLPYYTRKEMRRHLVKPGLIGYAQLKGRNNLDWESRFALDTYYVDNVSLLLDIKIFFEIIPSVICAKDVIDLSEEYEDEFGRYNVYDGKKYRRLDDERRMLKILYKRDEKAEKK